MYKQAPPYAIYTRSLRWGPGDWFFKCAALVKKDWDIRKAEDPAGPFKDGSAKGVGNGKFEDILMRKKPQVWEDPGVVIKALHEEKQYGRLCL